jgi:hypothetical protein
MMANESSSVLKNVLLVGAVLVAAYFIFANFQAKEQRDVAQTRAAALEATLKELQGELDAEKARPVTLEFARPKSDEDPRLYLQVQAGKKVRFYNRTEDVDLNVKYEAGAFPDLTDNPFTVDPTKHLDVTLDPQATDGMVYVIDTVDKLKHGGAEMIVGGGP